MCRDKRSNTNQQEVFVSSKHLVIDESFYYVHPIYDLYAASRDGKIIHIIKHFPSYGHKQRNGYLQCCVRKYGDKNYSGAPRARGTP